MSKLSKAAALLILILTSLPIGLRAQEIQLPEQVNAQIKAPLAKVGQGTYRKFGFRVYEAILWAAQGKWDAEKPYALQLCYARDLSKDTLVDTVMDDIREQGVADEPTLEKWKADLNASLKDVKEGDTLTGISIPGKPTQLFHNNIKISSVSDKTFSAAFFNIWLGKNADEDLRKKLLAE